MKYTINMASGVISSFIKIGTAFQAVLRFRFSNLNGCNVGIADGTELSSALFTWTQVVGSTYKVLRRLVQVLKAH
jgi:hypothetical protein